MSAPYQAVWFDLDGTLLDTAPDLIAAVNRALVQHGHAPAPPESILPYAGHGSRAMLMHALAAAPNAPACPPCRRRFTPIICSISPSTPAGSPAWKISSRRWRRAVCLGAW